MAQASAATAVANIWKTTELKDKIVFTLVLPADLPRRLAHHGARASTSSPSPISSPIRVRAASSGCTTCSWAADCRARRSLRSGIMPYISASIFMQIAGAVLPQVEKMQKEEEGRKRLNQWTRYLTVALAVVQAWGFALFTESLPGAVANPGLMFKVQMVLFLTTGAMFVMWLGEQITERGVGNGASLIIFFSIVERFWPGIFDTVPIRQHGCHERRQADRARRAHGRGRGGRHRDHRRGPPGADPDSAAHDGARSHAGRREELHPAAHQFSRRHADHLRAVRDRRARRHCTVQRASAGRGRAISPTSSGPGSVAYYLLDRRF